MPGIYTPLLYIAAPFLLYLPFRRVILTLELYSGDINRITVPRNLFSNIFLFSTTR